MHASGLHAVPGWAGIRLANRMAKSTGLTRFRKGATLTRVEANMTKRKAKAKTVANAHSSARVGDWAWFADENRRLGLVPPRVSEATKTVVSMGSASAMPGLTWGTSAKDCITGGKLHDVEGSVCEDCFARKGHYVFPNVFKTHRMRLASLQDPDWVPHMAFLAGRGGAHFRWHDSGDLQSLWHLCMIVQVAEACPHVSFWLPTKEYRIVREWLRLFRRFPANLTVRISAPKRNKYAPKWVQDLGLPMALVHDDKPLPGAWPCPKTNPKTPKINTCDLAGECRACWDPRVPLVSYHRH